MKSIIHLVIASAALVTSSLASENIRQDSGLVGPGRYAPVKKEVSPQEDEKIKAIIGDPERAKVLAPDATLEDLDNYYTVPCYATGYVEEIFDKVQKAQASPESIREVQQLLPEGKLLSVHRFDKSETLEGSPAQITTTVRRTKDEVIGQESVIRVVAPKSGFLVDVKIFQDLLKAEKPQVSVKETEMSPEELAIQVSKLNVVDGKVHVAVHSDKEDLPLEGDSPAKAVSQVISLHD